MIASVLYAVDGSDMALAAMPALLSVADADQTEIVVLQVIDSPRMILAQEVPPPRHAEREAAQAVAAARTAAEAHLKEVVARLREAGAQRVETEIREGRAGEEIVECAFEREVELVVMGTHGRSGLGRMVMGSVASHVLREVQVPVTLVRATGD